MILTDENRVLDTDTVASDDIFYFTLDFSKPKSPDYFCHPLVFVETYQAPAVVLEIGPFTITLPFKWSIIISHGDQAEILPIRDISGVEHLAFCMNPISSFMPRTLPIRMTEIHNNAAWTSPPLDKTRMLVVPLGYERGPDGTMRKEPLCLIAGEPKTKASDTLDVASLC